MRIYVLSAGSEGWGAFAPEVPAMIPSVYRTRAKAIAACRALADEERQAFARLGSPIESSPEPEICKWDRPIWQFPELLVPVRPAARDAALARMDELEREIDHVVEGLPAASWDRRRGDDGWSVRTVMEHLASGCGVYVRRLETWPLDPDDAQRGAVTALSRVLVDHVGESFAVEQFGNNDEGVRVRWTPRKVLRVSRALQDGWLAHAAGGGPPPTPRHGVTSRGHEDQPDDDRPLTPGEARTLLDGDEQLRRAALQTPAVRAIALSYRYYRDRLLTWPDESAARWRAMRTAFHRSFAVLDDAALAGVRMAPNGLCDSVALVQGLAIGHLRDHLGQITTAIQEADAPRAGSRR